MTTKITEKNISQLANTGVNWQSVFTGDGSTGLTAVAGRGYFINTTSGTVTVTLPASPSAGDVVVLKDYARTWGTNNVTIASTLLDGGTTTSTFSTSGQTVTLVYMDGTKGWSLVNEDTTSQLSPSFISATGGTITTSGDFKIHTFTGDGCFVVSQAPGGSAPGVDYLVVAGGGGGGGQYIGGGGGGGGFRASSSTYAVGCAPGAPLINSVFALPVSASTYPVTVGAGGTGNASAGDTDSTRGSNSSFSTITSTGGGAGKQDQGPGNDTGQPGGSGGGGAGGAPGPTPTADVAGAGNTPPVSPPQGQTGGYGGTNPNAAPGNGPGSPFVAGGGGGAIGAGANGSRPAGTGGNGGAGAGVPNAFGTSGQSSGGYYYFSGGGGGNGSSCGPAGPTTTSGSGGLGGGGAGAPNSPATAGTANTGGGGGGTDSRPGPNAGGAGGKGIVILRYKFQ